MHKDLILALKHYTQQGLTFTKPIAEAESAAYAAFTFELAGCQIVFRMAKTTPTKTGQFVTLWKRIDKGPIQPFDCNDPIDFFIVGVRKGEHIGQFIFPKTILIQQGIVTDQQTGKRAIRVYPPWDGNLNKQAQKTQAWQLHYFYDLNAPSKELLAFLGQS